MNTPLAILGLPSVQDVVEKVAKFFFGGFADALTPDWLKNASGKFFSWMVTVPNPAAGKAGNIIVLEGYTMSLAIGIFGLVALATAVRYYLAGAVGDVNPLEGLGRIFGAAALLLTYNWIFLNATALVNQITHQILAWPVVARGLNALTKTLFVTSGFGADPLGAIFKLLALALVLMLCAVKIALLIVIVMLYVAGPIAIALWPLPELSGVTDSWKKALGALLTVPIVWTLLFATAAVFVKDIPALLGVGSSGFAKAAVAAIFTPIFSVMVLYIGYKAASGAFASIKMTGHNLVSSASPMGGSRSRAGAFATGLASSEARSAAKSNLPSGQAGGTSKLRQMALAGASAATGGAAGAAAATTGQAAASSAGGAATSGATSTAAKQLGAQAAANGTPGSGRSREDNNGASVPPPKPNSSAVPATPENGAAPGKTPKPPATVTPPAAVKPNGTPNSNGNASKPPRPAVLAVPGAPTAQSQRTPNSPANSGTKSPGTGPAAPPARQKLERAGSQAPNKRPSAPPPAAPTTSQPQTQRKAGTPRPGRRVPNSKD